MSHTRITTPPFLLLALFPFVRFDSDYALISCPLYKLNTLWNIFMILGRNVEQDEIMYHIQELLLTFGVMAFSLLELSPFVLFEVHFVCTL